MNISYDEDAIETQDEMESITESDDNENNDDFGDFEEDNDDNISEENVIGMEEDDDKDDYDDYNFREVEDDDNDNRESDYNNVYEEESIVDASIDINQMPNINEGASYFENSTSTLLFCWIQKHNICKFNFTMMNKFNNLLKYSTLKQRMHIMTW